MLKICALGYPEVYRNGELIEKFMSNKVVVLLCYLVLNPQTHARERLASLLWGDMPESKAKSNLRQALHDLNKRIGEEYFDITRQAVQFRQDQPHNVDVIQLRDVLDDAQPESEALEAVSELYRGDFLEGINLDVEGDLNDWLRVEQENLRLRYLDILERLSHNFMEAGQWKQAQSVLQKSLQVEPLREETYRKLMLSFARQGRYEEAIAQYELCQQTLDRELAVLPTEETITLYFRVRRARNKPEVMISVPAYTFVGREHDLMTLHRWLRAPLPRLITITGEGGVGKTRLAAQVVQSITHEYLDGVAFIPLESVENLVMGIAESLTNQGIIQLSKQTGDLVDEIVKLLADREMLLVLDNMGHLLDQYDFILRLLDAAPDLKILVTSRAVLNLRAEQVLRLDGLAYPQSSTINDWREYAAPTLFLQAATRTAHDYTLSAGDAPHLVEICNLVEGVPLALELAASQASRQTCADMIERIKARYDVLVSSMRDIPPRQISMRATFDYSWEMLKQAEQQVLMQLSVFAGASTIEAIQAVTGATAEMLDHLVDQSLLRRLDQGVYAMHELLRQYAAELLAMHQDTDAIKEKHARYYLTYMRDSKQALASLDAVNTMQQLTLEFDNLNTAWRNGIHQLDALASLVDASRKTLEIIYYRNGWSSTGVDLFEWSVEIAYQHGLKLLACRIDQTVCLLLYYTGRLQESIELANHLLAENERLQDPDLALTAHVEILLALLRLNQAEQAKPHSEMILHYIDQTTIPTLRSRAYSVVGGFMMQSGDLEQAATYQQKALTLAQQIGHRGYEAMALGNLGIAIGFSNPDKAAECFRGALEINEAMGDVQGMISGYSNLAIYGRVTGDRQLQETCLQRSIELTEQAGNEGGMAIVKQELGAAYYEWGDFQQSITEYRSALAYWKKQGSIGSQAVRLMRIGHSYRQLQEPERARNMYRQAALLIIQAEEVNLLVEVVIGLADLQPDPMLAAEWICAARHCMSQLAPLDYLEPYIQPVEAQLKAQVSDAVFARAKERGVALDLQTIVRDELLLTV